MLFVMPGLVPGIHVLIVPDKKDVDGRDICAKTRFALLPGHDGEQYCFQQNTLSSSRPSSP
jgi:hypothetical protein